MREKYNATQCNPMQYNAIQYNAIQCNAVQYNTMQCNATQHNVMQCNTTQSIQYKEIRFGRGALESNQFLLLKLKPNLVDDVR